MKKVQKIIKIAIIEDIHEIASGLKELFNAQEDMTCAQVYHNAEDAIQFIPKFPPDIVLSDIGLPNQSGIEAIKQIRQQNGQIEFCMFTVFEDNERIFNSLRSGAKGYILKNTSPTKITASIRELYNGGSPMNPDIARKVIDAFSLIHKEAPKNPLPLSKREFELLDLLSQGLLYKEISAELGITLGTVKQHIHKIYSKLEVINRTEALNKYRGNFI